MGGTGTGVEGGVGATALMVAAARAIETHRPDALARDVHAEHFVRAAKLSAHWPTHLEQVPGGDANPLWGRLGRYFGLRTRVLDDFLLDHARRGVDQVVLLGAGLDTRAFRLPWPPGRAVFEVDRREVLEFKNRVLAEQGAVPFAARAQVAADLRDDWAGALIDAGFDPAKPTAWLAEGLLLYLPPPAVRLLVATVDSLSPPRSAFAYEVKLGLERQAIRDNPVYSATKQQIGIDLLALFHPEPPDPAADLSTLGWSVTTRTPFDFTREHGRGPQPEPNDALAANRWTFCGKG